MLIRLRSQLQPVRALSRQPTHYLETVLVLEDRESSTRVSINSGLRHRLLSLSYLLTCLCDTQEEPNGQEPTCVVYESLRETYDAEQERNTGHPKGRVGGFETPIGGHFSEHVLFVDKRRVP